MSRKAWEIARRWAAHNEDRFIDLGIKPRRPKADGGSGNVHYEGSRFISYRTCVARYLVSPTGERYVLVDDHRYSMTTDRHVGEAASAAHRNKIFEVRELGDDEHSMQCNAEYLFNNAIRFATDAKEKWKAVWGPYAEENWENQLLKLCDRAMDYVRTSGVVYSPQRNFAELVADVRAFRKLRQDHFNHPTNIRKRERARARRLAVQVIGV